MDFPHIEHRKPKGPFPKSTFDWGNLHLACTKCNNAKGKQWNRRNPILDAAVDKPGDHLEYCAVYIKERTKRGKTTKDHADLNRDELVTARSTFFLQRMEAIDFIKRHPSNPRSRVLKMELSRMKKGEFGSFVDYIIKFYVRNA